MGFHFCASMVRWFGTFGHVVADRGQAVADRAIRSVREGWNAPRLPF